MLLCQVASRGLPLVARHFNGCKPFRYFLYSESVTGEIPRMISRVVLIRTDCPNMFLNPLTMVIKFNFFHWKSLHKITTLLITKNTQVHKGSKKR